MSVLIILHRWTVVNFLSLSLSILFTLLSSKHQQPLAPSTLSVIKNALPFLFSSVTQSCLTLCDPMDCNTPSFPVHHQLLKLTQTRVPQVSDAIQPSHPLLSPSPPAFNLSGHQGLFQ